MEDRECWHGIRGNKDWLIPSLAAASDQPNRADQGNKTKANEYLDSAEVLEEKMEIMAQLIKQSKFTSAYTGAGLSKSSGIPDYATKAKNSVVKAAKISSPMDAEPTYAHCVLTALERAGYIQNYVQQNHDGLPQKSGFPQAKMNEIHGAWYDPSNPVVQFNENLRSDLFQWMAEVEQETDLCLCLGTSLSGMNADRMAQTPAKKARKNPPQALGTIIINIQQTPLDSKTTVRIWATLDDAFAILAKKLELGPIRPIPPVLPRGEVFYIPYDATGGKDESLRMTLDLRVGAKLIIPIEESSRANCECVVTGRKGDHFLLDVTKKNGFKVPSILGSWWVVDAINGVVPRIPIVNISPIIEKAVEKDRTTEQTTNTQTLTQKLASILHI